MSLFCAHVEADQSGDLVKFDFVKKKEVRLLEEVFEVSVSLDNETMCLVCEDDHCIRVLPIGQRLEDEDSDGDDIDLVCLGSVSLGVFGWPPVFNFECFNF